MQHSITHHSVKIDCMYPKHILITHFELRQYFFFLYSCLDSLTRSNSYTTLQWCPFSVLASLIQLLVCLIFPVLLRVFYNVVGVVIEANWHNNILIIAYYYKNTNSLTSLIYIIWFTAINTPLQDSRLTENFKFSIPSFVMQAE